MGIFDFIATATYAAKVERIVAARLGILPISITKRQKERIIDAAQQGRAIGFSAERTADMCFETVKAIGKMDAMR